jgi:MFS family permease
LQVESLFSLAQLLTIFHWGALSDRIGRKPVLLLVRRRFERVINHDQLRFITNADETRAAADACGQGCIGSSLSSLVFGFSNSFVMIVIARCLNGAMNGNIAVLKCAL